MWYANREEEIPVWLNTVYGAVCETKSKNKHINHENNNII